MQITASLVFNMVAVCAAGVQLALGLVAATNDRHGGDDRLSDDALIRIDRYDVYYSEMNEWFPCSADFDWVPVSTL